MTPGPINPLSAGVAVLLFLVGAVASFLGLNALARPANFAERVATAEAMQRAASKVIPGQRRFTDTAVCSQAVLPAAQTVRATLAQLASGRELKVSDLQALPAPPQRALSGLAAIDIQLTAQGGQGEVLAMLADLNRASPSVFLDRLELRPKAGAVELKLSGRAFCAISTRR